MGYYGHFNAEKSSIMMDFQRQRVSPVCFKIKGGWSLKGDSTVRTGCRSSVNSIGSLVDRFLDSMGLKFQT